MAVKTIGGPPNPFPKEFPTHTLRAHTLLHRVHDAAYAANAPNPSVASLYRFSPLFDRDNAVVPVLYAGESQECAFMETVFRGVTDGGVRQSIRAAKLRNRVYSTVRVTRDLRLARLDGNGLAFFRLEQQQLTATTPEFYAITGRWCEAIYRADPTLDGLLWVSHRATPQLAYLLFGTAVTPADLEIASASASLLHEATKWRALKDTADSIRVKIPDFSGMPS
jgi:hypothetical protein